MGEENLSKDPAGGKLGFLFEIMPLPWWGIGGSVLMSITAFITALFYRNAVGDRYSFTQYFISELGEMAQSEIYWLFNWGLIVGGLMLLVFIIGVGLHLKNKLGYVSMVIGIFSAIMASGVGVFPMDYMEAHIVVAMSFFTGGMITVAMFSITFAIDKNKVFPRWYVLLGVFVALWFALFLYYPYPPIAGQSEEFSLDPGEFTRPEIWLMPFFEWMVFFSVMLWMIALAVNLLKRGIKSPYN